MQKVRPVQGDLHSAAQQLVVIGALGPRGQALVVAGRQDQLHVHAGQRGDAQRAEGGVVGHEIRRHQREFAAGEMDQRDYRVARILERIGRAAGQQLGGHPAVMAGLGGHHVQPAAGFDVPVAGEHRLQMRHHRPAHARDQLAVGLAGHERRLGQVLRTHIGHAVVEHRDLAVVAQVHAAAAAPAQAAGQHRVHVHAAGQQALAVAAQAALGAHRVQQQAAGDAARGGAQQRLRHRLADAVVEHQVIEQVDFAVGVVDVVDQRTQRDFVVVQQLHRVAAGGHEVALALDQRRDLGAGRVRRRQPAQGVQPGLAFADHVGGFVLPADALARQPRVAEQQVQRQPEHRHETDQQQPAARGGGVGAHRDPQQRADPDQPVQQDQPEAALAQQRGGGSKRQGVEAHGAGLCGAAARKRKSPPCGGLSA